MESPKRLTATRTSGALRDRALSTLLSQSSSHSDRGIGRIFLGIVMMPFYYISEPHSVPGYLQLRFEEGARGVSAASFALMLLLMSCVNMYEMAMMMLTALCWNITFCIWS